MNEQIKQLAIESKLIAPEYNGFDHTRLSISQQKFAELIVRECINCCDEVDRINEAFIQDYDYDPQDGPKECIQVIKQHFGVGDIPAPSKPS